MPYGINPLILGMNNPQGKRRSGGADNGMDDKLKMAASIVEQQYFKNSPLPEDQILQPILFTVANTINGWRIKTPDDKG